MNYDSFSLLHQTSQCSNAIDEDNMNILIHDFCFLRWIAVELTLHVIPSGNMIYLEYYGTEIPVFLPWLRRITGTMTNICVRYKNI